MAAIGEGLPGWENKVRRIQNHFAVEIESLRARQHHAVARIVNNRARHQRFGDRIRCLTVTRIMPARVRF
ncbi:hypothetical protein D3C72_1725540 [compost metagenome]